ncbi:glycogen debranching enzyme family protein [Leptolyngbya sp. FACHB-261]|nr:glycogen debranching enzyme family protein [Leptolyngbya sp. FACHB-261]
MQGSETQVLHPRQDEPDQREWLLTDGLGSMSSGTLCDAHTRTYHGLLVAALEPPVGRTLLLSRLEVILETEGEVIELSTNFWTSGVVSPLGFEVLQSFTLSPVPTWVWSGTTANGSDWSITRRILMPHAGLPAANGATPLCSRVLIEYSYQGSKTANLMVRPLIAERSFHHQQRSRPELFFTQTMQPQQVVLQAHPQRSPGVPWALRWSSGRYTADGFWYWNLQYPRETERGLNDREDLFSPGYLSTRLLPGETLTLEAVVAVGASRATNSEILLPTDSPPNFEQELNRESERLTGLFGSLPLWQEPTGAALLKASDQFVVHRISTDSPSIIAGYPWFDDWGRDLLIALPGLALCTKRYDLARELLQTCARYCRDGLIPNLFPAPGQEPLYNSIDAALLWIETLGLYLNATQDWEFLASQFGTVQQILKGYMIGTHYGIQIDPVDQLISWGASNVALTWMDAVVDGQAITPRTGKPVEINALWYSALCWAADWSARLDDQNPTRADRYRQRAEQVRVALQRFWNAEIGYLYDCLRPDGVPDGAIRPNAVLALALHHCGFEVPQARRVLALARDCLLTPVGLRSLDPHSPAYIGHYGGNVQKRDRAYHQGSVWSWLIGPFGRAWRRFYPDEPLSVNLQPLLTHLTQDACIGSISEIFDGDAPYTAQGAVAQAWSVSELLRLLME